MSVGRRVRACTRLSGPAKALTTCDYVRGISGPSTLLNTYYCTAIWSNLVEEVGTRGREGFRIRQ
jgi:hypothetical protein